MDSFIHRPILACLRGLISQPLLDIQFLGVVEVNGQEAEFTISHRVAYFTFDESLIAFQADMATSRIMIRPMESLETSTMGFDDVLPACVSVASLMLWDADANNHLTKITLYGADSSDPECLSASAICMELENGQLLFVDALSSLGLNMGGEGHRQVWQQNQSRIPSYLVEPLEL